MKKLFLAVVLASAGAAHANLEITVSGGEVAAQPIAIVPFARTAEVTEDLAAIVAADLSRSGQFLPLPVSEMLERPTDAAQVDYRNWRAVGVDNVVVGQVRKLPNGQLSARFQLLDVLRARELMAYDVPVTDLKRMRPVAHQIADLVYEKLTGVPGYFNSQIAYVAASGNPKSRLFQVIVADADGFGPMTVATSREPLRSIAWSPDRRQLAYVGYERGRSAIYLHTLATGELRKLVSERGINGAPAFAPDGRAMAVSLSFGTNSDIYVIDIASGAQRRLTSHFAIETEPSWSPDGREIAFTSDRGGQPQIYIASAAGGEARRLTFEGKQNLEATFSPNGKLLAVVNQDETGYRIGVLDLGSRELRIVSNGPLDESPSFAPNSSVVIYTSQGRQGAELATVSVDGRIRQRLSQPGDVREPAWSPARR